MTTSAAGGQPPGDRELLIDETDAVTLRFVRLRLPGFRLPVHVLREAGPTVEDGPWSGAEQLFTRDGQLQAAHSRRRLRQEYYAQHSAQLEEAPVLVLDLVRTRRALTRPHSTWSGTTRGTLADFDDLLWDAAASLGDDAAASMVRDAAGFHAQYLYVWGNRPEPLGAALRAKHWDDGIAWLLANLNVMDHLDRRNLARR